MRTYFRGDAGGIQPEIRAKMNLLGASDSEELLSVCESADRSPEDRANTCHLVGTLKRRSAVDRLLSVGLKEEDAVLAWTAISAVGHIRSKTATRKLIYILRTEFSAIRRQAAVSALMMLGDRRALPALVQALSSKDEDTAVRSLSAEALGMLRETPLSRSALLNALKDSSKHVRYGALCGLRTMRCKRSIPAFRELVSDEAYL